MLVEIKCFDSGHHKTPKLSVKYANFMSKITKLGNIDNLLPLRCSNMPNMKYSSKLCEND